LTGLAEVTIRKQREIQGRQNGSKVVRYHRGQRSDDVPTARQWILWRPAQGQIMEKWRTMKAKLSRCSWKGFEHAGALRLESYWGTGQRRTRGGHYDFVKLVSGALSSLGRYPQSVRTRRHSCNTRPRSQGRGRHLAQQTFSWRRRPESRA